MGGWSEPSLPNPSQEARRDLDEAKLARVNDIRLFRLTVKPSADRPNSRPFPSTVAKTTS